MSALRLSSVDQVRCVLMNGCNAILRISIFNAIPSFCVKHADKLRIIAILIMNSGSIGMLDFYQITAIFSYFSIFVAIIESSNSICVIRDCYQLVSVIIGKRTNQLCSSTVSCCHDGSKLYFIFIRMPSSVVITVSRSIVQKTDFIAIGILDVLEITISKIFLVLSLILHRVAEIRRCAALRNFQTQPVFILKHTIIIFLKVMLCSIAITINKIGCVTNLGSFYAFQNR